MDQTQKLSRHFTLKSYGTICRRMPKGSPVLACTALRNPHRCRPLGGLTGLQRPVQLFLAADPALPELLDQAKTHLAQEDSLYFSCLGGRHRSVYVAELMAQTLRAEGHTVTVMHLELC